MWVISKVEELKWIPAQIIIIIIMKRSDVGDWWMQKRSTQQPFNVVVHKTSPKK